MDYSPPVERRKYQAQININYWCDICEQYIYDPQSHPNLCGKYSSRRYNTKDKCECVIL